MNKNNKIPKIGIITHWGSLYNYGQQFQAYALIKSIEEILPNSNIILIRYMNEQKKSFFDKILIFLHKSMYVLIHFYKVFDSKTRHYCITKIVKKIKKIDKASVYNNDNKEFKIFQKKYLHYSEEEFFNYHELKKNSEDIDILITGSDQVWGPYFFSSGILGFHCIDAFTLKFGSIDTKRIAYAASFGCSTPQKKHLKRIVKNIEHFNAISVREKQGVELLNSHNINHVEWVPDPTLLVDSKIFSKLIKTGLIYSKECFYYGLTTSSLIEPQQIIDSLSSNYNKTDYSFTMGTLFPYEGDCNATIEEWISYIANSKLVITNSFHGIVFCLIYHTPFYYIPLKSKNGNIDTRINSLLDLVEVEDRAISNLEELKSVLSCPNNNLNWNTVDCKLTMFKDKGKLFLEKALV